MYIIYIYIYMMSLHLYPHKIALLKHQPHPHGATTPPSRSLNPLLGCVGPPQAAGKQHQRRGENHAVGGQVSDGQLVAWDGHGTTGYSHMVVSLQIWIEQDSKNYNRTIKEYQWNNGTIMELNYKYNIRINNHVELRITSRWLWLGTLCQRIVIRSEKNIPWDDREQSGLNMGEPSELGI